MSCCAKSPNKKSPQDEEKPADNNVDLPPAEADPAPPAEPLPADHKLVELFGAELLSKGSDGTTKTIPTTEALAGKTAIAIYFSAHWCPPCRGFTPQFAENYSKYYKSKGLEVVFASSDRDEASFKDYFGSSMPWLALPFDKKEVKQKLSELCGVQGIPMVVILDRESGGIVNKEGRKCVMEDERGEKLPWGKSNQVWV